MGIKEFEIAVPRSAVDLRIKHYNIFKARSGIMNKTLLGKVELISNMTGTPTHLIKMLEKKDVEKIWNQCIIALAGLKTNGNPPKEIVLDGIELSLIDPDKVSTGWHIDFTEAAKSRALDKDPVRLACLFYYPKGSIYGETDANSNLIHPIKDRYELIQEHMPLQVFVESLGFFLQKWHRSTSIYMVRELTKKKTAEWISKYRISGKKQLMR